MTSREIGRNIQLLRASKGKTQAAFAVEIGKSRIMLSRYENGMSVVSLVLIDLMALKLNTTREIMLTPPQDTDVPARSTL